MKVGRTFFCDENLGWTRNKKEPKIAQVRVGKQLFCQFLKWSWKADGDEDWQNPFYGREIVDYVKWTTDDQNNQSLTRMWLLWFCSKWVFLMLTRNV